MIGKSKLGRRLLALFSPGRWDGDFFENLEDVLIEGDLGAMAAMRTVEELKKGIKERRLKTEEGYIGELKAILGAMLKVAPLLPERGALNVFLILGVNGVGKTTTIAKLAAHYRAGGLDKILLSAGDTFRAGAINQLKLHAERLDLNIVSQLQGSDPGAVIFDTVTRAVARGDELVLADTAGRMHNKSDLVRELSKIDKIIRAKIGMGNYRKVLIIDSTTGQNALHQAETFHAAVGVDSAILAKYDSTAKGGIAIAICRSTGIPFSFMGTGEKPDDIIPFDKDIYLDSLLGNA